MALTFYTINDKTKKLNLVAALIGREQEIHSYDINIANYETMLASLPKDEWPVLIEAYKNQAPETVPADLQQLVSDYSFRDRLRDLLATENLERNKAVRIYEAVVAQLPEEEIPSLIAEVMAQRQA